MQLTQAGERPVDHLVQKYEKKLPVGTDSYEKESVHFGICSAAFVRSEIIDGNALISTEQVTDTEGVIFYSIIPGVIVTVILLTVRRVKSGKEQSRGRKT